MMALKYVALLLLFLFSFLCHTLAICFLNQASFLINTANSLIVDSTSVENDRLGLPDTRDYIGEVLERGFTLNFAGNRLFYAGVPLLLWIFGPLLAFLSSVVMLPILYNLDVVNLIKSDTGCVNTRDGKSADTKNGDCMHQLKFVPKEKKIAVEAEKGQHLLVGISMRRKLPLAPSLTTVSPREDPAASPARVEKNLRTLGSVGSRRAYEGRWRRRAAASFRPELSSGVGWLSTARTLGHGRQLLQSPAPGLRRVSSSILSVQSERLATPARLGAKSMEVQQDRAGQPAFLAGFALQGEAFHHHYHEQ
ncbi:hypothetical protein PR202_ga15400 [Eleusine coracana subsp. coracana]|uniref:Uncharacterized protein n=1 Tax=Eleusine coracana subsp. coracana TaxID=191504 RepID=A0AAV5CJR1_ELECO|nr:hypothetical protein PR202_ga15400 [Eleusine coracana subsp. coracana]